MSTVIYKNKKTKQTVIVQDKFTSFMLCFIFGFFYPLFKKDWLGSGLFFISLLVGTALNIGFIVLIFNSIFYRAIYIKNLELNGFKESK